MAASVVIPIDSHSTVAKVIVPLIRLAATVGFALVPASLGFLLLGVAEQLVSRLMVR